MKGLLGLGVVALVMIVVALVIFWPLVMIWSINTLFGLGIPYTFWTWLAMLVLNLAFGAKATTSSK